MKVSKVYLLTAVSFVFFLVKGVSYAVIGSYIPLIFSVLFGSSLYVTFKWNQKIHFILLRVWASLIILWAISRFGIWLIFKIDSSLSETHIREQFGLVEHGISALMLVIGVSILVIYRKNKYLSS